MQNIFFIIEQIKNTESAHLCCVHDGGGGRKEMHNIHRWPEIDCVTLLDNIPLSTNNNCFPQVQPFIIKQFVSESTNNCSFKIEAIGADEVKAANLKKNLTNVGEVVFKKLYMKIE